jgi:hypothetical protein
MIIDKNQLMELRRDGAKIERPDGQGLLEPERAPEKTQVELLSEISDKLDRLIETQEKPEPEPQPIHVHPPKVTVNLPEPKRHRKWKHVVTKDAQGRTKEIISTAIE